jgi:hypothetical protein
MIGDVYEVFELLEFQTILQSFDTIDEAVKSYKKASGDTGAKSADSGENSTSGDSGARVATSPGHKAD